MTTLTLPLRPARPLDAAGLTLGERLDRRLGELTGARRGRVPRLQRAHGAPATPAAAPAAAPSCAEPPGVDSPAMRIGAVPENPLEWMIARSNAAPRPLLETQMA